MNLAPSQDSMSLSPHKQVTRETPALGSTSHSEKFKLFTLLLVEKNKRITFQQKRERLGFI